VTLRVQVHPAAWTHRFERDRTVLLGRGRQTDVRLGHQPVQGRWTVSKLHAEVAWDGTRWSTTNRSDKPGLLQVYEPGYEEVVLEPGRPWVPVRHRWSYAFGRPGHRVTVLCATDDHRGPAVAALPASGGAPPDLGEDPTTGLDEYVALRLTPLERDVLLAYYSGFTLLPRPESLEPRSHDEAARRLGRSKDSTRKAIERVNEKVARLDDAPALATGRNVTSEVGRWLARTGAIDPD